jgi:Domain of unknown function (DUF4190)
MKRCPTCNRTFEEDWLAFCTQDGATLVQELPARDEPPPTILSSAPPPPAGDWMQPSGGLGSGQFQSQPVPPPVPPSNVAGSPGGFGSGQFQPQPQQQMQSGWQPPPPPPYAKPKKQGLAIASMILGIVSIPGTCLCYVGGIPLSLAAIILGSISLVQIKNDPENNTGKPLALTGVIIGAAYLVFCIVIVLIYGFAIFAASLGNH